MVKQLDDLDDAIHKIKNVGKIFLTEIQTSKENYKFVPQEGLR